MQEKVQCPICGGFYKKITWNHLKMHGLAVSEFEELYPNFSRVSESLRESARLKSNDQWSDMEARESARLRGIKQFSIQESRDGMSEISLQYNKDHPEKGSNHSEFMVGRFSNQIERDVQADRLLQYHLDNPESAESARIRGIERYADQSVRDEMAETMRNSDVHRMAIKNMIGSNDFVWHHVAYDFLRPKALRIRIKRKFHGLIHHPKGMKISKRGYSLID